MGAKKPGLGLRRAGTGCGLTGRGTGTGTGRGTERGLGERSAFSQIPRYGCFTAVFAAFSARAAFSFSCSAIAIGCHGAPGG